MSKVPFDPTFCVELFGLDFEEVKKAVESYKIIDSKLAAYDGCRLFGKSFAEVLKCIVHCKKCKDNPHVYNSTSGDSNEKKSNETF